MQRSGTESKPFAPTSLCLLAALALPSCRSGDSESTPYGLRLLTADERTTLLESMAFDEVGSAHVLAAFEIEADFGGDLGAAADLPVPLSTSPASEDQEAMLLLGRVETFGILDNAVRPRFVAPVFYEEDDAKAARLTARGDLVAGFVDEGQRVGRAFGNQPGTYLIIAPRSGDSFQLVVGTVSLSSFGPGYGSSPWEGATVSASTSPLLATSGPSGRFAVAASRGRTSLLAAVRTTDVGRTEEPNPATAVGAVRLVAPASGREEAEAGLTQRLELFGDPQRAAGIQAAYDDVLGTRDLLEDRLPVVATSLAFEIPRGSPAFPLTDDLDPPSLPTPDVPAEDLPPVGSPTLRVDRESTPQLDLGCSGFDGSGRAIGMVRSGSGIGAGERGWQARGDVRYAYDFAATIFGAPEALGSHYLDNIPGYCVVSTGEEQAARAYGDHAYLPGPQGRGLASDIAQRVLIPQVARSIQVRAAILTQEYPVAPGPGLTDALYFRFDESPRPIALATLSELNATADFRPVAAPMHGRLWNVEQSPSAAPGGYQGYLPPRLFCRDLDPVREAGHVMTLRLGVSDGSDRLFDTALLIDAVVFGDAPCSDLSALMTNDTLVTLPY